MLALRRPFPALSLSSALERDEAPTIDDCVPMRREPTSGMRAHALDAFAGAPDDGCC